MDDQRFAHEMEAMYRRDLTNATEIVLDVKNRVRAPGAPAHPPPSVTTSGGSASRAAAGALRVGRAVSAAVTARRTFEPVESRLLILTAALFLGFAALLAFLPDLLLYPVIAIFLWIGLALLYKAWKLRRAGPQIEATPTPGDASNEVSRITGEEP